MYLIHVFDPATNAWGFAQERQEVPTGAVNGSNQAFVLAKTPITAASVKVYLDGLILPVTSAYSVNVGTKTVTLTVAPSLGQDVYVTYLG